MPNYEGQHMFNAVVRVTFEVSAEDSLTAQALVEKALDSGEWNEVYQCARQWIRLVEVFPQPGLAEEKCDGSGPA